MAELRRGNREAAGALTDLLWPDVAVVFPYCVDWQGFETN
jgi:hypothetical protein